jgi:hypothetical protein
MVKHQKPIQMRNPFMIQVNPHPSFFLSYLFVCISEFSLENHNSENDFVDISSDGIIRRPERFTPSDVAKFIRKIDPSFENLACRFLQEVFISISIISKSFP